MGRGNARVMVARVRVTMPSDFEKSMAGDLCFDYLRTED